MNNSSSHPRRRGVPLTHWALAACVIGTMPLQADWVSEVTADAPSYWWRFENANVAAGVPNQGSVAGFDGTFGAGITDADLVAGTGATGQALQFTGPNANNATTKYVDFGADIPELTNFRPPSVNKSTTVEYWIKTSQTGDGDNTWTNPSVFGDESPGDGDFYWGNLANNGEFRVSTSDIREIRASGVTDGEWHHIVMVKTWDTAGPSTSALYIDGGTAGRRPDPYRQHGRRKCQLPRYG